jgi:NAD(P)-dependent dehydrogenase (short-subunit alcohol dehydrogenase family)
MKCKISSYAEGNEPAAAATSRSTTWPRAQDEAASESGGREAKETEGRVGEWGRNCLLIAGDVGEEKFCRKAVEKTIGDLGKIDILVNKAAEQHPQDSIEKINEKQLEKIFRTNIFAMFFLVKAAMKHFEKGSAIIKAASVTAYKGSPHLLDYSSTKGAIVAFTRSPSQALVEKRFA